MSTEFGAAGNRSAIAGGSITTIHPTTTLLGHGSVRTVYRLPDGEVITNTTPPAGFDPLRATNARLARYNFPLPHGTQSDRASWKTAMAAYKSDSPPTGSLRVTSGAGSRVGSAARRFATEYSNWGGYIAGKADTQSNTYVAVTNDFTVPSNSNTCTSSNLVGLWTGLGGTSSNPDNLVQQGIECGDTAVGSGSAYRPFTEFADTANPVVFCGETSWTFPAGHLLDSSGAWVAFGSQGTVTKTIAGTSSSAYCISPGSIGSNEESFTDSWHQAAC